MDAAKYTLLKRSLNLNTAIKWLDHDSRDDFYPDPINFADIKSRPAEFLKRWEHRLFQLDAIPYRVEYVPKRNAMLREALWLHPIHRILYIAILHYILHRLDSRLTSSVYSFRVDTLDNPDAYPFIRRMERWKNFINDFREAALDSSSNAILTTDLASFFDHIDCRQLCMRIKSLLGPSSDATDDAVIELLQQLLLMWSHDGFGIPQNYDASSFFGSLYLHPVDQEMVNARYRYFRWLDDIRIVTKSHDQAIRALHNLQQCLAKHRLFLSTAKTDIISRGNKKYDNLMDVSDDNIISKAEEVIKTGDKKKIKSIVEPMFKRTEYHATENGDDRKFRAYANRLLDAGDYKELYEEIHPRIHKLVLPRMRSHPERSDYWMKMLSVNPSVDVINEVKSFLVDKPSLFDWQRYYLWKLGIACPLPHPPGLMEKALEVSGSTLSDLVTSQAIIYVGKHGDNVARESLFSAHFTAQRSYPVQRAVLIAMQELPKSTLDYYYRRALEINTDHKELIEYLYSLGSPQYGDKKRDVKKFLTIPRVVETKIQRGVGLIEGKIVHFRLSRNDYDYE
jgi:hypothetical protein